MAPKAPKDAADHFLSKVGNGILKLDTDQLRSLSQQLTQKAATTLSLGDKVTASAEEAAAEAANFTSKYRPAGIYDELLKSLSDVSEKYVSEISKMHDKLENDAAALNWLADHHDEVQKESVAKTEGVDTNIMGGSSTPTATTPAPSAPIVSA